MEHAYLFMVFLCWIDVHKVNRSSPMDYGVYFIFGVPFLIQTFIVRWELWINEVLEGVFKQGLLNILEGGLSQRVVLEHSFRSFNLGV